MVAAAATSASAAEIDPLPVTDLGLPVGTDRPTHLRNPAMTSVMARSQAAAATAPEECLTVSGDEPAILRAAGADRYETAACVSYWTWYDHDDPDAPVDFRADAVVLARGDAFPDALAGGPLAAHAQGPLLLTRPTSLPSAVLTEIERVLAPGGLVYLLGGTSSVSNGIRDQLRDAGYTTRRLSGPNRYETAIAIAEELPDTSNFFFVTGKNFPDALAASTAAASLTLGAKFDSDPDTRPFALLLTDDDQMPTSTGGFAVDRGLMFGEWTLVTAGGKADRAAAAAFGPSSLGLRIVGASRYETAALIAEILYTDVNGELWRNGAGLATGTKFPDALGAGVLLALFGEPLLLTNPTQLSGPTEDFLDAHAGEGDHLDVFGGTSTVSDTVANQAAAAFSAAS